MRISDWSSDVCSSDLLAIEPGPYIGPVGGVAPTYAPDAPRTVGNRCGCRSGLRPRRSALLQATARNVVRQVPQPHRPEQHRERTGIGFGPARSEEHTSEPQSLMHSSYAVFCLKKKTNYKYKQQNYPLHRTHTHTIQ